MTTRRSVLRLAGAAGLVLPGLARAQGKEVADPSIWAGTTLPLPAGPRRGVLSGAAIDARA